MHAYIQHTFALARVLAHILDVQDQGFLLVSKLDTSDEKSTTKQNQRLNKTYFFLKHLDASVRIAHCNHLHGM